MRASSRQTKTTSQFTSATKRATRDHATLPFRSFRGRVAWGHSRLARDRATASVKATMPVNKPAQRNHTNAANTASDANQRTHISDIVTAYETPATVSTAAAERT
jgi:hypothetical protein